MNFGEQFKKFRIDMKLTQEQVATQLHISRQAVSNWENNKNLPDIEMIVDIARTFHLSLDQLILGDEAENNLTEKLIKDGSETRRAKLNLVSVCIGTMLLIMGAGCILIKANSVEYIDANGILHENFFLLPIGFLFLFSGVLTFVFAGITNMFRSLREKIKARRKTKKDEDTAVSGIKS